MNHAEKFGLAIIISIVCVAQYVLYLYSRHQQVRQEEELRNLLKQAELNLETERRDHRMSRSETQALTNIFSERDSNRTVDMLLKTLVPQSTSGFALFWSYDQNDLYLYTQRGLSKSTCDQIVLDEEWIDRAILDGFHMVSDAELFQSRFVTTLSTHEREKIRELYMLSVRDGENVFGILATTQLFPVGCPVGQQQEVTERLIDRIATALRHRMQTLGQEQELKLTQEKLILRAIADQFHDVPHRLMDDFLKRLVGLVAADRGAIMLMSKKGNQAVRSISRQGTPLQEGADQIWKDHETRIAEWAYTQGATGSMHSSELTEAGVDSLIGKALTIPLYQADRMIGLICLTRKDEGAFTRMQISLAAWAGEFLTETLLRAIDRVTVERKANQDGLTGLANRRTFDDRITLEIHQAKRAGSECSLLLLDLDHFKSINDRYGHPGGDEVLRQFAHLLETESRKVRSTDFPLVARYGGEEMAVLLPGVGLQGALRIGESIRKAAEDMVILHQEQKIQVTVSIGVACYPRHSTTVEKLIETADQALYQAKSEGRNRVCSPVDQKQHEVSEQPKTEQQESVDDSSVLHG
ncbi:MAG: GGDEF domain-containing protein [Planctomycetaceae bacterium]|nr:GGDEF domain-containing protein [Planctomycetaceae bacterium]